MKNKLIAILLSSIVLPVFAQIAPPPATQAEVDAGVNVYKYLTPFTFANSSLIAGGGISAGTAAAISLAVGQTNPASRAANVSVGATGDTNSVIGTSGRHLARYAFPRTQQRLIQTAPLRVLFLGDSTATEPSTIARGLYNIMGWNGSVISAGNSSAGGDDFSRFETNGIGTFANELDADWAGYKYRMTTNSALTWTNGANHYSNGIAANFLELYAWKGSGFTNLIVQTQAYGGSWATYATVPMSNASLVMYSTNWTLPAVIPNLQVRVTSGGTNMVLGLGIWNTNLGAGFRSTVLTANSATYASYPSNSLRTVIQGLAPDLVICSFKNGTEAAQSNGVIMVEGIMTGVAPDADVLYLAPNEGAAETDATSNPLRRGIESAALQYGRPVFDVKSVFSPPTRWNTNTYFTDGSLHLLAPGSRVLANRLSEFIGLNPDNVLNYGLLPRTNRIFGSTLENRIGLLPVIDSGLENNYSGIYFEANVDAPSFANVGLMGQTASTWLNSTTTVGMKVANTYVLSSTASAMTIAVPVAAPAYFSGTNSINTGAYAAGLSYFTNLAGNITLSPFASIPANSWVITIAAKNTSGADRTVTFPNGTVNNLNGVGPAVAYVTNNTTLIMQVTGFGSSFTNVLTPH